MSNPEESKITISSTSRYHEASMRFRDVWNEYQGKLGEVKFEIVNMVKILEKEGLNRTQSIQKIIDDHNDLPGFSRASIYRELPEDMKDKNLGKPKKSLVQPNISREILGQPNTEEEDEENNVTEQSGEGFHRNVIEDSSMIKNLDPALDQPLHDLPEPEEIYDPNLLNKHIKEIAKLQEENAKLKIERIPTRANKSDFRYEMEFTDEMFLMIKANSGICPLIGTHFCDKDDGYMRFDKEKIQQDIKKTQKAKAK